MPETLWPGGRSLCLARIMSDPGIRHAVPADIDAVLTFWGEATEGRFVALGGRRVDAMVLVRNESAHHAWSAAGYGPEEKWRRWVKPLGG